MRVQTRPLVAHLDGYFDNPTGDFSIEEAILTPHGIDFLSLNEETQARAAEADVVMFRAARVDEALLHTLKHCRTLIRHGIGLDRLDLSAATERGIRVCNIPDFCIPEMADHTLSLALGISRKLFVYHGIATTGDWALTRKHPLYSSESLVFATIGFGRIAREVLSRARSFAFQCVATDPHVPAEVIASAGVTPLPLQELLGKADILSLHCPLTAGTRSLIDDKALRTMKQTAVIINTARGALIDTAALTEALQKGRLAGAGLDVSEPEPLPFGHPLYGLPNVIITPHVAWYSEQAEIRLKTHAAQEALRAIRAEPLRYCVNGPRETQA